MALHISHSLSKGTKLLFEIAIVLMLSYSNLMYFLAPAMLGVHLFILHLYKCSFINKITLFIALADFVRYPRRKIVLLMKGKDCPGNISKHFLIRSMFQQLRSLHSTKLHNIFNYGFHSNGSFFEFLRNQI